LDVITTVIMRLMFPTFARMQEDRQKLGRAFLRTSGAIALIAFPLMAGLAVVADPFVRVVLGENWLPIIPLVQILAPLAMLHALGALPGQLFLACGRAAFRLWWSVIYTTVIMAAVTLGLRWGIRGVATAYAAVMVPIIIIAFQLALHMVGLGLLAWWKTLRLTLAAAIGMAAMVSTLQFMLDRLDLPPGFMLATDVTAGIASYVLLIRLLRPEALYDVQKILPESLRAQPFLVWLCARAPAAGERIAGSRTA
ncbi:MAG: oligosaccharide flippase family protein, partial [Longimicrobiales bacterium]